MPAMMSDAPIVISWVDCTLTKFFSMLFLLFSCSVLVFPFDNKPANDVLLVEEIRQLYNMYCGVR